MNFWSFQQFDYRDPDKELRQALYEEIRHGRLRQGWSSSKKDDIRRVTEDSRESLGYDDYPFQALQLMRKIVPGDILLVQSQPSPDSFLLCRASSSPENDPDAPCYSFIPWDFQRDRYSVISIDPASVQEYRISKLDPIIEKKLGERSYKSPVKRIAGKTADSAKFKEVLEKLMVTQDLLLADRWLLELIKNNHQLVLTGPPGTGKTHTARGLADQLTGYESKDSETDPLRTEFVQFHPSYDYTDFVEGLRPQPKETSGGELSFKLQNGIFKEFCRKAGVVERMWARDGVLDKEKLGEFCKNVPDAEEFWKSQTFWGKIKKQKDLDDLVEADDFPKFVFIIDEINRAELSKVFGELMYSIESSYRGPKGKIKTQYAQMKNDDAWFLSPTDDRFFVPSNVYIIGTMNDIDRSVETFDFALRRRFAWHEITADDAMESVLTGVLEKDKVAKTDENYKKMVERASSLNKAIRGHGNLGSQYAIGPSYFSKGWKAGKFISFEHVWTYHLAPLLQEYLRGIPKWEETLKGFENAFNLKQEQERPNPDSKQ